MTSDKQNYFIKTCLTAEMSRPYRKSRRGRGIGSSVVQSFVGLTKPPVMDLKNPLLHIKARVFIFLLQVFESLRTSKISKICFSKNGRFYFSYFIFII